MKKQTKSKRGAAQLKKAGKAGSNKKGKKGLSDKAKAFVLYYLKDANGTQAAIKAGFSAKTAKTRACLLMQDPRIRAMIEEFQADRREEAIISFDERARILSQIAKADIADEEKGTSVKGGPWNSTKRKLSDRIYAIKELNEMYGDHAPKRLEARISSGIDGMTEEEAQAELDRYEQEEATLEVGKGKAQPTG